MTVEEIKDMVRSAPGITEFQRRVYLALLDVPKGSLITYGELALKVGCKSPRAVGNALHKNPFAPLVPCHRVVRANGEIGGYAFGEQEKLRLLREEALISSPVNRHSKGHKLHSCERRRLYTHIHQRGSYQQSARLCRLQN